MVLLLQQSGIIFTAERLKLGHFAPLALWRNDALISVPTCWSSAFTPAAVQSPQPAQLVKYSPLRHNQDTESK